MLFAGAGRKCAGSAGGEEKAHPRLWPRWELHPGLGSALLEGRAAGKGSGSLTSPCPPLLQGRFYIFFSCIKQASPFWCLLRWSVCQFLKGASLRCCTRLLNAGVLLFPCGSVWLNKCIQIIPHYFMVKSRRIFYI